MTNAAAIAAELDATIIVARDLAQLGRALEATVLVGEIAARYAVAIGGTADLWCIENTIDMLRDRRLEKAIADRRAQESAERVAYNISCGMSPERARAIG